MKANMLGRVSGGGGGGGKRSSKKNLKSTKALFFLAPSPCRFQFPYSVTLPGQKILILTEDEKIK